MAERDEQEQVDPATRLIVVLGNTAGGKSELAVRLAERLGGEVVGADSMQVYRHMDAGTAKPEPELRARAPHHVFDIVEPTEPFTAHDWLRHAEAAIADIQSRGKRPIVVGGTNFYLKALLEGLMDGPGRDEDYRATLDGIEPPVLHERLQAVDPEAAERIKPNDRQRLVRALEVFHTTGRPISDWQQEWSDVPPSSYRYDPQLVGIRWPTEQINRRINARVKVMFEPPDGGESLPDESKRLDEAGLLGPQAREALGYKQCLTLPDLDTAFERTKVLTRRFAKQQRTWMKRFLGVHWIDMEDGVSFDDATDGAIEQLGSSS